VKTEFIKRNYPAEFRAEAESGLVVGVPVVFNTPTDIGGLFQETILSGAITDRVLRNDVAFFFDHDLRGMKLARSVIPLENFGGMEFEIQQDKIVMRANTNRKRTDANNLYLSIQDGTTDGMSFMFRVVRDRWEDLDTDYPKRFIEEIDPIIEVSAVNYPAYASTSINVARGDLLTETDKVVIGQLRERQRAAAETEARNKRELELLKIKAKLY
jgi:HK97 family phage prohead protease